MIDPKGETFRADGSLFMSYANDACSGRFSGEQIDAMHANVLNRRSELIKNPTPQATVDVEGGVQPITPSAGETVSTGEVLISWEPVKNATHYYIEVSIFPNMAVLIEREIISSNEFMASNITFDRPHFWRVRPFLSLIHI